MDEDNKTDEDIKNKGKEALDKDLEALMNVVEAIEGYSLQDRLRIFRAVNLLLPPK